MYTHIAVAFYNVFFYGFVRKAESASHGPSHANRPQIFETIIGFLLVSWCAVLACGWLVVAEVVLGAFGMRFVDSMHRLDLWVRLVDWIRSLDRSIVLHAIVISLLTQQLVPAECAKRVKIIDQLEFIAGFRGREDQ